MERKYKVYFQKSRKSAPTALPESFETRNDAMVRAINHLDLFASMGIKGTIAIVSDDDAIASQDDIYLGYKITRVGTSEEIPDVIEDESEEDNSK